tara:strand:+ start:842 stop:1399 length:558 start_codon:yes stop_codon:yes gene_type:complete
MKSLIIIIFIMITINSNSYASTKEKILDNFKKIKNLSFNFKQTIDGKDERGNCILKYPKKIFCKYKMDNKKILVANGKSLAIKNYKNKQYYLYDLESTPLNLILDKDFLISKIKNSDGKIINEKYYNFLIKDNNNTINIYFDNLNYNLIGWQVEDAYQNLTVTFIYDIKVNTQIKNKLFELPKMF